VKHITFIAMGGVVYWPHENRRRFMEDIMLTIAPTKFSMGDAYPQVSGQHRATGDEVMKILLVDAHFLIREALRDMVREIKNRAIVMEAVNGQQAMQLLSEQPDIGIVLLDLNLPDREGFSMLTELCDRHPEMSVVVLSARDDHDSVGKALDLGAVGFIPKSAQREIMVGALRLVFAGGTYIPPEILARGASTLPAEATHRETSARPARPTGLTERQVDVLHLLMQGKSNKGICRVLNLAEATVKNHVTAILRAVNATNRTEAVIAVRGLGRRVPFAVSGAKRV
jgi:DNA-binding NarL/FixJ family response regulator